MRCLTPESLLFPPESHGQLHSLSNSASTPEKLNASLYLTHAFSRVSLGKKHIVTCNISQERLPFAIAIYHLQFVVTWQPTNLNSQKNNWEKPASLPEKLEETKANENELESSLQSKATGETVHVFCIMLTRCRLWFITRGATSCSCVYQ